MKLKAYFDDIFERLKYLCLCRYRTPSEQSYKERLYLQRLYMQKNEGWSNDEEIFENREQIEISRFYERLPKTNAIALKEFLDDKVYFRMPSDSSEEA